MRSRPPADGGRKPAWNGTPGGPGLGNYLFFLYNMWKCLTRGPPVATIPFAETASTDEHPWWIYAGRRFLAGGLDKSAFWKCAGNLFSHFVQNVGFEGLHLVPDML